jgi:hypothetical protein
MIIDARLKFTDNNVIPIMDNDPLKGSVIPRVCFIICYN